MKVQKKKKTESDFSKYSMFCFRLTAEERDEVVDLLDAAKERLNKGKRDDERVFTKNQIALEAIRLGLPKVKRER